MMETDEWIVKVEKLRTEQLRKFPGFDCPIHGLEMTVFCFRAFDEANLDRWQWWSMMTTGESMSKIEAQEVVAEMEEARTRKSM